VTLGPGQVLSHYRLDEQIGEGGMGVVWKATDTRLDRQVAVKVLAESFLQDHQRLSWFEREAKAIAALNHPNIVTLHSVEEHDGCRFIVMELIEGTTLSRVIPDEGLPLEQFFVIAIGLADALSAAHEKGIIHRDIKPANIMVGAEHRTKILDFGLAKLAEHEGPIDLHDRPTDIISHEDTVIGTTPYMSPERLQGETVDARSDIFSLGIVLYEMATGALPFAGRTMAEAATALLRDAPKSPAEHDPELPRHLVRIILRCLEKDPRRRYQTALDIRNELRGLRRELESGSVPSVPLTGPVPAPRPAGWRNPILIAAAVAVVAVAVASFFALRPDPGGTLDGAAGVTGDAERTMIAILPFGNLGEPKDQFFADGMTQEITSRLAMFRELGVISRTSAMRYAGGERPSLQQIGAELGVEYVLDGTVRWAGDGGGPSRVRVTPELIRVADETNLWSENYDRELDDVFEIQSEIADNVALSLGVELLETGEGGQRRPQTTTNPEAYRAYLEGVAAAGRPGFIIENYLLAVQMFELAVELDPEYAQAHARLSDAHSSVYMLGNDRSDVRAEAALRSALRALELAPLLSQARVALGHYHYRVHRDYEKALAEYRIAAADLPNDTALLTGIGFCLRRQGRFEDALAYQKRAVRLDPLSAQLVRPLSSTYLCLGNLEQALQAAQDAIDLSPDDLTAYWLKSGTQLAMGQPEAAVATMSAIVDSGGWFEEYWLGVTHYYARDFRAALGRFTALDRELVIHQRRYAPKTLLQAEVLAAMGNADAARGAYRAALPALQRALEADPDDSRIHAELGLTYAGLDRTVPALEHARRAAELLPSSLDALDGPDRAVKLVRTLARLGRADETFEEVERLLRSHPGMSFSVPLMTIDPDFDALREHDDYLRIVEEYGESPG
jgi:TolB-like protein/Flp pilus assembly protein TadD/tRNA A-37 threonylcarbamoyl transferase component Bud32